jgi:hypothetical protein
MTSFSRPKALAPATVQGTDYPVAQIPEGFTTLSLVLEMLRSRLPDRFVATEQEVLDIEEPIRLALLNNKCQAFVLRPSGERDPIDPRNWSDEAFVQAAFAGWYERGAGTVVLSEPALKVVQDSPAFQLPAQMRDLPVGLYEPLFADWFADPLSATQPPRHKVLEWVWDHWRDEFGPRPDKRTKGNREWVRIVEMLVRRAPNKSKGTSNNCR